MPFHRAYDSRARLLCTTVTGAVTIQDIDDHLDIITRTGAEFRPELIDVRFVAPGVVAGRMLLLVAHRARRRLGWRLVGRRAFVVGSDAHFALARKFACYVAGWLRVGVFDDLESAREWLLQPVTVPVATAPGDAHVAAS